MIYPWIWHHLPGPKPLRLLLALLLVAVAVVVLFLVVFPWAEHGLPWLEVTVDSGAAAAT